MSGSSDTLILGTRKGTLIFKRQSDRWELATRAHVGIPIAYSAVDSRSGTLWSCIDYGHWGQKLERSDDCGETWQMVETPKYPDGAIYWTGEPGSENKREVAATVQYLWVVQEGGRDQPGTFYIGTVPGGLFKTGDDGRSFELLRSLWDHPSRKDTWFGGGKDHPGIHSVVVDPRDSSHVYIGISCAGVFETRDGGATWEGRNKGLTANFLPDPNAEYGHDPHFIDCCAAAPDVLWMQNHCGIFRSVNGGAEWAPLSQADGYPHFGFAIAADAEDPDTAWVVPGDSDEKRIAPRDRLAVCRTSDGGQSWQELTNGLPAGNAFDITLRHALAVSGDRVAFGSTTGNVYLSENRGDRWACLGNNLPPVYSVRFAPQGWGR